MTVKVFALDTQPGIQRDGTVFDKNFYNDGQWVRFQRGRPRKVGGYRMITNEMKGPSRGMWVSSQNALTSVFSGHSAGLQNLQIDQNGVGAGVTDFTLSDFTSSALNLWQFDGFYDVAGAGLNTLIAHPGQNLAAIDNTTNTPVLIGNINGSTMSQIGVFTDTLTTTNGLTAATVAVANPLIGVGQTVTGANLAAGTTIAAVSGVNITLSQNATGTGAAVTTFNNNVSVSGGVVVLHPYIFVFGNDGLVKNCSAGNAQDWVSADANETNVAAGKIVAGLPVRGGSNAPSGLLWSLDSLIRVSYIGGTGSPAQYWRYDIISSQSSIMSSQSVIEYDGIYYWCGVDRFLLYNGTVKEIPNLMNQNYFFDNLNYNHRQKVWVTKVPRFGEIWWHYPRGDSTECNDAIIYNVRENCWYDAGSADGARRSAGYFSQVFHYPIRADWEVIETQTITSGSYAVNNGSEFLYADTYDPLITVGLIATSTNLPADTEVLAITTSGIKTLGAITGGALYVDGAYTDVPLTGGAGANATADITVAGGAVTVVTIVNVGAGYLVNDALSADAADLGGAGAGFSVPVSAIYAQVIELSAAATGSATETVTFSTPPDQIKVFQHEVGTDHIEGQNVFAIESSFETSDLGLVAGGPSQTALEGANRWLRLERVEPDFLLDGEMSLYVTGRPYAQTEDYESNAYVFDGSTNKIDMKEQRRELRLKFVSDTAGGDYQLGRLLLSADVGDVRGY